MDAFGKMPNFTRRQVLKATGAASLGLMVPGAGGRLHGDMGSRAGSVAGAGASDALDSNGRPTGAVATQDPAVSGTDAQVGITQSVARWCFEDIPLRPFCAAVAEMGLPAMICCSWTNGRSRTTTGWSSHAAMSLREPSRMG